MEMEYCKGNQSTPCNKVLNCVQEKLKLIHNSETPQRFNKSRNPFETILHEKLHTHFFSPTVFTKVKNRDEEDGKWTIDQISSILPSNIDESNAQFETPERNSLIESLVQSKIDKYFSMQEIVPSPLDQGIIRELYLTPENIHKSNLVDNSAQTVLTLPPVLPDYLEAALKPFCTYTKDQQGGEFIETSINRKLFEFEIPDTDTESVCTSPAKSINLSPAREIGYLEGRTETPDKLDILKDCEYSPICNNLMQKSKFSSHMSVDCSFNVPDVDNPGDKTQSSENTSSPLPDLLSDSSVHWDLEYKHIGTPTSSNTSLNKMDVSNSTTPNSRNYSRRKNLSRSFRRELEFEDCAEQKSSYIRSMHGSEEIDSGFQSCSTFEEESVTWKTSTPLFASTPTKFKQFQ